VFLEQEREFAARVDMIYHQANVHPFTGPLPKHFAFMYKTDTHGHDAPKREDIF
jgi:hypothetical protein